MFRYIGPIICSVASPPLTQPLSGRYTKICLAAGDPIYFYSLISATINIFESNKDANNANKRLYNRVSFGV